MREVTFVGASNGELVLQAEDGERLVLPLSDQLRSAIRLAPNPKPSPEVSPREIQDAIRAGASVADIVSSSGADEDFVLKFATPVLEELEHMVRSALSVRVEIGQDRFNEAQFAEFGELIESRLSTAGASSVAWSAHRESPTTWLITASFTLSGEVGSAAWTFDPRKFTLSPENTTAISLSNNQNLSDGPIPRTSQVHPSVAEPLPKATSDQETTLLDAFRARREAASLESREESAPVAQATVIEEAAETPAVSAAEDAEKEEPASTKKGRAPMPSWDEIVFGAKTED